MEVVVGGRRCMSTLGPKRSLMVHQDPLIMGMLGYLLLKPKKDNSSLRLPYTPTSSLFHPYAKNPIPARHARARA